VAPPVVADLVKHHVVTLKDVIDAQASKDPARAYTALRAAAGHMHGHVLEVRSRARLRAPPRIWAVLGPPVARVRLSTGGE
jgi:hypothetical protein